MFSCERCGSKFHSTRAAAIEHCPRCLLKDDVSSPLLFAPFEAMQRGYPFGSEPGAGRGRT
jgi:hypothetical protein